MRGQGRFLFGAAAVFFGVIALMWHDADTWQALRHLWTLPFGSAIGALLMAAQIAGGLGLLFARTVRYASILLIAVFALFSLTCVPAIFTHPKVFDAYDGFFEQFALLCGAIAVYAASGINRSQADRLAQIARIGIGLCAVSFTLAQLLNLRLTAQLVPMWIPPNQMFWAILTTVAFALAAIAILANYRSRLALQMMTLMIALFGILVWIPILAAHPEVHGTWSEFGINFLVAGAAWVVADAPKM